MVTSSAVVGSSAISSFGSQASAIAMATPGHGSGMTPLRPQRSATRFDELLAGADVDELAKATAEARTLAAELSQQK
jgi:hypothetical protein